jgi:hypothetical protein
MLYTGEGATWVMDACHYNDHRAKDKASAPSHRNISPFAKDIEIWAIWWIVVENGRMTRHRGRWDWGTDSKIVR